MTAALASTRHTLLAVIDAAVWAGWSALCGYVSHRLPASTLSHEGPLRLRAVERDGRLYERGLRIKGWKDALPEAGSLFRGGFSKRRLRRRDREYLEEFRIATLRAEWTHWAILALSPVFFAWNPWWLASAMLGYGVVANVPCLLVQRYNRARIDRTLDRVPARTGAARPAAP